MNVDDLPVKQGSRLRGMEMTRIETFTDAAFAFALTLLVLSPSAPKTFHELQDILKDIPVFVFGAANLMVFWHGHNEWSRRFGLDDFPTIVLSIALVSSVLTYVYSLRYVGAMFFNSLAHLTHLPVGHAELLPPNVLDVNHGFVVYGIGFCANAFVLILLNLHALRHRDEMALNELEVFSTQSEIGAWSILCVVGVISAIVGIVFPTIPGSPGMAYMLLSVIMPIYGSRMNRKRKLLENTTSGAQKEPSHGKLLEALGAKNRKSGRSR